jgi:hypothetical protein
MQIARPEYSEQRGRERPTKAAVPKMVPECSILMPERIGTVRPGRRHSIFVLNHAQIERKNSGGGANRSSKSGRWSIIFSPPQTKKILGQDDP